MPCPAVLPPDVLCAMEPNACYMWSDRLKLGMALEWAVWVWSRGSRKGWSHQVYVSKLTSNPCF